jgi:hypothetical protein
MAKAVARTKAPGTVKAPPRAKPAARTKAAARAKPAAASERDFVAQAREALRRNEPDAIPDTLLQNVLAAAVKVYAAKAEKKGTVRPYRDGAVTTTESVVTACALIRAADLNLFDVAMWFNRPPGAS